MPIKVDVTQEDIDRAMRNDSARCVVAQAIARTIPQATRIMVDVQTVRFTDARGVRRVYLTPQDVERYVVAFDAGDKIEPFGFGLYDSQRVNVPRTSHSESTRKRERARQKVRRHETKAAQVEADPQASEETKAAAVERLATARVEFENVKAGVPDDGPSHTRTHPEPEPGVIAAKRAPRTVRHGGAKSNERRYGHRALRINQER